MTQNQAHQPMSSRLLFVISFATLVLLQGIGCNGPVPIPSSISKDEYDIYRVMLEGLSGDWKSTLTYVSDSTFQTDPWHDHPGTLQISALSINIDVALESMKSWKGFDPEMFRHFLLETSKRSYRLHIDSLHLPEQYRSEAVYPKNSVHNLEADSLGRTLSVRFSRVAMNPAQDECLFYMEYGCGFLCGSGQWYWLRRVNGKWTEVKRKLVWVS